MFPLSLFYSLVLWIRRKMYAKRIIPSYTPQKPCVSVGNISVGGTGKTPITAWFLGWAEQKNISAVVLTRGYGAKQGNAPVLVEKYTLASVAGDEPLQLAKDFPKASVISYPKRIVSAKLAEQKLSPEVFILDDGMQHLAVRRNADIILLHEEDLLGRWNKVLPWGLWREGARALETASAFAIKVTEKRWKEIEAIATKRLKKYGVPLFTFELKATGLQPLVDKTLLSKGQQTTQSTHALREIKEYLLLSGVGNPDQVATTATDLTAISPLQRLDFPDHYVYKEKDIEKILLTAGSLPIICTAKDAVKLEPLLSLFKGHPLFVMKTKVQFGATLFTDKTFPLWWEEWWSKNA